MPPSNIERYVRSIFVQNIPAGINEETFRQTLTQFGSLLTFHMFPDPTSAANPLDKTAATSRSFAFAEFGSAEIAQFVITQLNRLVLGGLGFVTDFISKQPEPIINLFEQLCPIQITTITSTNKNDPRLANATTTAAPPVATTGAASASAPAPVPVMAAEAFGSNPSGGREDRESISNAVASLPPAQMFELMKQMKQCIEANPNEAKTLLSTNPQLAYALLQAQVVMRIVDPQVAMALLNRTDKDVIPAPTDVKKPLATTTQATAAVTAPLSLPVAGNPAAPFPFPMIPGVPFTIPMLPPNPAGAQQAATAAFLQAAMLSGAGLFPPAMPPTVPFPPSFNPMAPPMRTPNLDENAALLLLQLDDAQLAQLPPQQSMQIRTLREQIAKTGLLPKM